MRAERVCIVCGGPTAGGSDLCGLPCAEKWRQEAKGRTWEDQYGTDPDDAEDPYNKYNVAPRAEREREIDGKRVVFASKLEACTYDVLHRWEVAGVITALVRQPEFSFAVGEGELRTGNGRALKYRADFSYVIADTGERVVQDSKGVLTNVYEIKSALMWNCYGIRVFVTGQDWVNAGGWLPGHVPVAKPVRNVLPAKGKYRKQARKQTHRQGGGRQNG